MTTGTRLMWVDLARWIAVMAMFVAHVAPFAGPLTPVLNVSDHLAVALFAATMGVGAQLGVEAFRPRGRGVAAWVAAGVTRGALLVLLGLLAERFGALVVDVLPHLGALAVVIAVLVLLSTRALLAVAAVTLALTPWLMDQLRPVMTQAMVEGPEWWWRTLDVLGGGMYYRLPSLIVWACLGALLVRFSRGPSASRGRIAAISGGCGVLGLGLLAAHRAGVVTIEPYAGTHAQVVLSGALAVAVLAGAAAALPEARTWAEPLAVAGSMALTLYVAQFAFLGWWIRGHSTDDSWVTLAVLTIGGTAAAVVWRRLPLPEVLRRGLLDGPVTAVVRAVRDLVAGRGAALSPSTSVRRSPRG